MGRATAQGGSLHSDGKISLRLQQKESLTVTESDEDNDLGVAKLAADLGTRGAEFWAEATGAYDFRKDELQLLLEVCRSLDLADDLHAEVPRTGFVVGGSRGQLVVHPVVAELRSVRLAIAAMLKQLHLPDAEDAARPTLSSVRSEAGYKGAESRWRTSG